ncbi:MAG: MarR family winged helix-turn-helix transcriptional regulator [Betaproteobacteria bacterium]|nr:MarR family winged helix-turn-helix transcriptional regulator [Betaproteobacteria bacterium]
MLNRIFRGKVSWPELNNSHWPFVRELWEQDGISQRELADRARMRPPTCLAALRGLEMSKMVRRVPDKSDRRRINVFLTQKGRDMYHRVVPELKQIHDLATRGVSNQDLETLMSVLRRMRNNLAEHSR